MEYMLQHILQKWRNLDKDIATNEFEQFLHNKMKFDPDLENLAESTVRKLSTNMNRMLKEVGIVKDGVLQKQDFDGHVFKRIIENGDVWFLQALFMTESEIKSLLS